MKHLSCLSLSFMVMALPLLGFSQSTTCLEAKLSSYENGALVFQTEKKYDANRLLLSQKEFYKGYTTEKQFTYTPTQKIATVSYLLNGILIKKTTNVYDAKGNVISEITENNKGEKETTFTNAVGEKLLNDANGNTISREQNTLTADGKVAKNIVFNAKNEAISELQFLYDTNGNITEKVQNDLLAKVNKKTTYLYDAKGNKTEETTLLNEEPFTKLQNTYDSNGNLVSTKGFNKYNKEDFTLELTYTADNKIVTDSYVYNNELISQKKYTYDAQGNRIKEDYFERQKLVRSTEWEFICNQ